MSVAENVKKIVVFGANSHMAVHWLRSMPYQHAEVLLVSRDEETLQDLRRDIETRKNYKVSVMSGDLTSPLFLEQCLSKIASELSGIDHALIAYGVLGEQKNLECNPKAACELIDLNFSSKARLMLGLLEKDLFRVQASLTVISSVAGDRGRRSNFIYGSAYAGLNAFVEGFAARLQADQVFVQLVKPGFVDTPMTKHVKKNFLFVSPEKVGRDIWRAHHRRCYKTYTPWFWLWIMFIMRIIPGFIFRKMKF